MKKFFFILISLLFTSCGIAQVDQLPVYVVNAYVQKIEGDVTTLQPSDSSITFETPSVSDLIVDKERTFWLEIPPNQTGRTVKAVIVKHALTTGQAQRDQEQNTKDLSDRVIIRKPYRN